MTFGSFSMGFWLNLRPEVVNLSTKHPFVGFGILDPVGSMVLIYLPTFWVHFYGDKVGPY